MMCFFHPGDFKNVAPVHCFVSWNFGLMIKKEPFSVLTTINSYSLERHHFNLFFTLSTL